MMYRKIFLLHIVLIAIIKPHDLLAQNRPENVILWSKAAELPSVNDQKNLGLAGVFAGQHNGVLIVAGGSNFPEAMPWNGGQKAYYQELCVFEKDGKGTLHRVGNNQHLKQATAYGGSASTPEGVVCAGGETDKGATGSAFLMQWDAVRKELRFRDLPDLPLALTAIGMTSIGHTVYVMGGSTGRGASAKLFSLDLQAAQPQWQSLPDMPLAATHLAVTAQSNGEYPCLYVLGGRMTDSTGHSLLYDHTLCFDPKTRQWKKLSPIGGTSSAITLSAAMATSTGSNYILLVGGDDGALFRKLEDLSLQIDSLPDGPEKDALLQEKIKVLNTHPGFHKDVYVYNTVTDAWTTVGTIPSDVPVTSAAVIWGNDVFIPGGEIKPGVRTPIVLKGSIQHQSIFSWMDTAVLVLCFLMMTLGRFFLTGHTNNTSDYFKGGQRIPQWAAAISIFGAKLSAITFMGIPAKTYASNWTYFFYLMTIVMIMPFVARYFIPFYRRLNVTSAYEYLSKRFNVSTRMIASSLFILLQLGRMGIVVLLPSIALTLVTGININVCIILIGMISIFFTVKGGIEAVIWVEVIQVLILASGALLCLVYIPFQLHDWEGGVRALTAAGKLKTFDFRFDVTEPTFWVVVIGGLAINLLTYGTDQTTVQRYLTTRTERESVNSLKIGAWLTVPSTLVFFSIGTLLFLFFREQPGQVNIALDNQDNIFPWYIVSQLPAGLSGLLIAGIFAASMSSTEASMNSTATLLTTDFYKRWKTDVNERQVLFFARAATFLLGLFVTCIALYMAHQGVSSLWDKFNTILGLFTGCIGGAFILGIFTRRAHGAGVIAGMISSCIVQLLVQGYTQIHLLLYAFTGLVSCVLMGYVFSLIFPAGHHEIKGLTIYPEVDDNV